LDHESLVFLQYIEDGGNKQRFFPSFLFFHLFRLNSSLSTPHTLLSPPARWPVETALLLPCVV
jgi:hypothetical protein